MGTIVVCTIGATLGCHYAAKESHRDCSGPTVVNAKPEWCLQANCRASVQLKEDLDIEFERALGARLEICLASYCSGAVFDSAGSPVEAFPDGRSPDYLLFRFGEHRSYAAVRRKGPKQLAFEAGWDPAESQSVCTGDEFHVLLKDRVGRTLFERREQVSSHSAKEINGLGCPPVCRHLTFAPYGTPLPLPPPIAPHPPKPPVPWWDRDQ